jgi:UDP-glucose 4-epimerase
VPRRLADTSKAERVLGFRTRISVDEGLRSVVEWWQHEQATVRS